MAATDRDGRTRIIKGSRAHDARRYAGLWPLGAGDHQYGRLRHFRLQLHEAQDTPRLALVWRFFDVHRRAVHGDVRLPADDLSAFGLAYAHLSGHRSVLA